MWDYDATSRYTPKVGYIHLSVEDQAKESVWWWRILWKFKFPTKEKILRWTILERKVPTWDILQKRQFTGPSWFFLCRYSQENIVHLFIGCNYTKAIWFESLCFLNYLAQWQGQDVEEALISWSRNPITKPFHALPMILSWGVWII